MILRITHCNLNIISNWFFTLLAAYASTRMEATFNVATTVQEDDNIFSHKQKFSSREGFHMCKLLKLFEKRYWKPVTALDPWPGEFSELSYFNNADDSKHLIINA